jgi:hypothetical protein
MNNSHGPKGLHVLPPDPALHPVFDGRSPSLYPVSPPPRYDLSAGDRRLTEGEGEGEGEDDVNSISS